MKDPGILESEYVWPFGDVMCSLALMNSHPLVALRAFEEGIV